MMKQRGCEEARRLGRCLRPRAATAAFFLWAAHRSRQRCEHDGASWRSKLEFHPGASALPTRQLLRVALATCQLAWAVGWIHVKIACHSGGAERRQNFSGSFEAADCCWLRQQEKPRHRLSRARRARWHRVTSGWLESQPLRYDGCVRREERGPRSCYFGSVGSLGARWLLQPLPQI